MQYNPLSEIIRNAQLFKKDSRPVCEECDEDIKDDKYFYCEGCKSFICSECKRDKKEDGELVTIICPTDASCGGNKYTLCPYCFTIDDMNNYNMYVCNDCGCRCNESYVDHTKDEDNPIYYCMSC